jgi:hypothetical protein
MVDEAITKLSKSRDAKDAKTVVVLKKIQTKLSAAKKAWRGKVAAEAAKVAGGPGSDRAKDIMVAKALNPLERALAKSLRPLIDEIRGLPGKGIKELAGKLGGTRMLPPSVFKTPGRFRKVMYDDPVDWPSVRAAFNNDARPGIDLKVAELHGWSPKISTGDSPAFYDQAEEQVAKMASEPEDDSPKRPGSPGQLDKDAVKWWKQGKLEEYYLNTEYQVDHIGSLAEHWVTSGYNTGEEARKNKAKKWSNLRLITRKWNSSKGSASQDGDEGEEARYHYNDKPHIGDKFGSQFLDEDANKLDGDLLIQVDEKT